MTTHMDLIKFRTDWPSELRASFRSLDALLDFIELSPEQLDISPEAAQQFELRVPRPFARRIAKGDPNDPLLRQVLPVTAELAQVEGFVVDPLAEKDARVCEGLIHKYQDRVLLVASGACAINCRYCFRRHFPYDTNQLGPKQWQRVVEYIGEHPELREVIFSGGDPLATPDRRLARMLDDLEQIPHLRRVRFHTRLPVAIPARLTDELTQRLSDSRLDTVLVLHINHANEIDTELTEALWPLRRAGVTLLNQSVLLKGVNDSVDALHSLCEAVFAGGILPYYLFVLDPVVGSAHFDISDSEAQRLFGELQTRLSGYLLPRLAREIPGKPSKTLLLPDKPAATD